MCRACHKSRLRWSCRRVDGVRRSSWWYKYTHNTHKHAHICIQDIELAHISDRNNATVRRQHRPASRLCTLICPRGERRRAFKFIIFERISEDMTSYPSVCMLCVCVCVFVLNLEMNVSSSVLAFKAAIERIFRVFSKFLINKLIT